LATLPGKPDRGASLLGLSYANAQARLAEDARRAVALAAAGQAAEARNIINQGVSREQRRFASLSRFVDLNNRTDDVKQLHAALAESVKGLLIAVSGNHPIRGVGAPGVNMPGAPGVNMPGAPGATDDPRVPLRNPDVKGPLPPGGEWVTEKAGARASAIAIARLPAGDDLTYEIVNFINGQRSVSEIRDAVSAEFEPVDVRAVAEYLDLLAAAGAITYRR
ncbi:MAG TPA: hypothetical protein VGY48_33750, partial [Vicinamibacterales bacterium]|nr:hypothetical protein [Vicinamibacterales bacterium]